LQLARQEVLGIIIKLACIILTANVSPLLHPNRAPWGQIAFYLTHDYVRASHMPHFYTGTNSKQDAWRIIESIWRKWDIVNDCPLPEGVERVSGYGQWGRESMVVWKKTGTQYYTVAETSSLSGYRRWPPRPPRPLVAVVRA
jgi:hypothetical protein